jgi:hypothetical protein
VIPTLQTINFETLYFVFGLMVYFLYLSLTTWLISKIRAEDSILFISLGEPHVIFNNTPRHAVLFTKWLWYGNTFNLSRSRVLVFHVFHVFHVVRFLCFVALLWFFGGFFVIKIWN